MKYFYHSLRSEINLILTFHTAVNIILNDAHCLKNYTKRVMGATGLCKLRSANLWCNHCRSPKHSCLKIKARMFTNTVNHFFSFTTALQAPFNSANQKQIWDHVKSTKKRLRFFMEKWFWWENVATEIRFSVVVII